jgi:hypothetical protein
MKISKEKLELLFSGACESGSGNRLDSFSQAMDYKCFMKIPKEKLELLFSGACESGSGNRLV